MKNRKVKCLLCGNKFLPETRVKTERRWCSEDCRSKAEKIMDMKNQNRFKQKICIVCGDPITNKNRSYCTDKCKSVGHKLRHADYDIKRYKNDWWHRKLIGTRINAKQRDIYFDDDLFNNEFYIPKY